MTVSQRAFLHQRDYLAVSITHFFVDILNSGRTLLVALLAISVGLTNTQVGIALLLYNVGSSLSQPLFGWLADRAGPRWLTIGGMGWMILFYSIASLGTDWLALIALTMAGLGSGATHPTGTMVASQSSQTHRTQATALFFMAGQLGLFSGPVMAGVLLEQYGRPGYLVLPVTAFIAFASSWQWLSHKHGHSHTQPQRTAAHKDSVSGGARIAKRRVLLLAVIILVGSTVSVTAVNFSPKLFTEMGYAPGYVGWLAGLFMAGSAVGGIVGGSLADRYGGKLVILIGILGTILPIYFYIPAAGSVRFALILLAGFFGGMPHSVLILMAQSLLPGRQALASGLALGFMFFSGSVGSLFVGVLADRLDLAIVLQGTALLPFVSATAAMLLPKGSADTANSQNSLEPMSLTPSP